MSHDLPEKTREIFGKKPYLALYFRESPEEPSRFQLIQAKNQGEVFLSRDGRALASSVSPLTQARRQLENTKISSTDIVAVLGLGNPHLIREVHSRMEPGQILLLVDKERDLLFPLWNDWLESVMDIPGRHLFLGENSLSLLWNYVESLPVERVSGIRILRNAASISQDEPFYAEVDMRLRKVLSSKMSDLLTKFEFERIWVKNSLVNTSNFLSANNPRTRIESLKEKFAGVPSLLVSAGPNLRRQCEWIRSVRDKVFILSCDTSLKVLLKHGIVPDGIMTLDAQTHSVFHFLGEDTSQIPLFADLVSSPPILRNQKFQSIVHSVTAKYIVDASGELKREATAGSHSAEALLGPIGDVQSGGSVATTAFDLLRGLGCRPCFLVGQDLAYSGREIHSTGTHHNEKWLTLLNRKTSLEKINESVVRKRDTRYVPSVTGGEVLTDYVLDLYRHWFEESAKSLEFPVYNVNTQGAKIENTGNIDPELASEILNRFPNHEYFWRNLPAWKSENLREILPDGSPQDFRADLLRVIDTIKTSFSNPEKKDSTYDTLLKEFKASLIGWEDLGYLVRKTEVYILRHRDSLEDSRKKDLFLGAVLKEFTGLRRKLLAG
ncbi:PF01973 family protein [Leptospira fainei serovar Hurstbridge str. BUT 6]|uniref:PF01973 family protein n=1 Tax=Leptospira fainei serovar Hurstbridge str. BUT 6 TaxID=1193011 RepID=S3V2W2_9LEPT|nr:6-hydroxymethylpterin diphosphokinase MptE-like protein [Leptospira fainei]EPG74974.1 PF01973 family protein [Leptospira fainei serovar Hurstbridge str. BUT 6]